VETPAIVPRTISMPPSSPRPGIRGPATSLVDPEWLNSVEDGRTTETAIAIPPQVKAAAARMHALLRIVTGFNAGQVFEIDKAESVIGRGRDATVRIEDAGVSRAHTKIAQTLDGKFVVSDMGSTNGTFVGGKKIERATELKPGDHIQIGPNIVLSFAVLDEMEQELAKQLYESSTKDALTKVFNRKYFAERLASEVAYANRHKTKLGVILFDLDHFKKVNDTLGHLAGDEVLRGVSACVLRMIRAEDVLARYGGEEFVILVRGIEHKNVAHFGERVRRGIEKLAIEWEGQNVAASISVGVATLDECGDLGTGEALLLLSDERLYQAKRTGRNRVISA
jgi:diguanylate cyclase (GGDEF)-like protein